MKKLLCAFLLSSVCFPQLTYSMMNGEQDFQKKGFQKHGNNQQASFLQNYSEAAQKRFVKKLVQSKRTEDLEEFISLLAKDKQYERAIDILGPLIKMYEEEKNEKKVLECCKRGLFLLQTASQAGKSSAMGELFLFYDESKKLLCQKGLYEEARMVRVKQARLREQLAKMYEEGQNVKKDLSIALNFYKDQKNIYLGLIQERPYEFDSYREGFLRSMQNVFRLEKLVEKK